MEAVAGVSTARITVTRSLQDSLPPAFASDDDSEAASLLTELAATKRSPGVPEVPELTLGSSPAPSPVKKAALGSKAGQSLGDWDDDPGMRISVVHGGSLEQLTTSNQRSKSHSPTPRAARSGHVARAASVRGLPSEAPSMGSVLKRLLPALRLIALGVAIMIADAAYAMASGQAFTIGPVRALWLAGPLVGLGVVRLVLSLVG